MSNNIFPNTASDLSGFKESLPCAACGHRHDYSAKECVNFLTFGQGGADFAESQRLAKLYEEECDRAELRRRGLDILSQSHERV